MKRRKAIILSVAGISALGTSLYFYKNSTQIDPVSEPSDLSLIWNDETVIQTGRQYLTLRPDENSEEVLIDLLAPNKHTSKSNIVAHLKNSVQADFENNNTIIINGWVLSATEARQCALFYLNK